MYPARVTTPEEKPEEKPEAKPEEKPEAKKAGKERTRGIVMMVLATAGLALLLTLVSETVFRPKPQPAPARSSEGTPGPTSFLAPSAELHAITVNTIVVTVSTEKIVVDGLEVARTEQLIKDDKQQLIPGLKTAMDQKAIGNPPTQKVGLIIEKDMNKNVIRSVYLTLRLAGYRDVHLVVDADSGAANAALLDADP